MGMMGMAAGEFVVAGFPDTHNRYVKQEVLARQGVISVHGYHIIGDPGYGNNPGSVGGLGFKLHPRFHLPDSLKTIQGHPDQEFFVPDSVSIRCGNRYFKTVPLCLAFQGPFQAGNNIFIPMEINQWVGTGGGINQLIFCIPQGIANTNYQVFSNIHDILYHNKKENV
jgi:hypothetical protein